MRRLWGSSRMCVRWYLVLEVLRDIFLLYHFTSQLLERCKSRMNFNIKSFSKDSVTVLLPNVGVTFLSKSRTSVEKERVICSGRTVPKWTRLRRKECGPNGRPYSVRLLLRLVTNLLQHPL